MVVWTEEQVHIRQKVVEEKSNLVICAKAGTGKTATLKFVGKEYIAKYDGDAIIMTFNAALRLECRKSLAEEKWGDRIKCHTYHSAALQYFLNRETRTDFTDSLLNDAILQEGPNAESGIEKIKLVLLDEVQDLTELLVQFVIFFIQQITILSGEKPLLVLCGDVFQKIYVFRGTSIEYMTNPEKYFGPVVTNEGHFETARLSLSFRLAPEIAAWINEHLHPKYLEHAMPREQWAKWGPIILTWWGEGIRADPKNKGEIPTYIKADKNYRKAVKQIAPLYQKYKNQNISVLCYSSQSYKTKAFLNALTEEAKPQAVNWVDFTADLTDDSVSAGKRKLSTIHKAKGLENEVIVVHGMDSLPERQANDILDVYCVYYVGCTRAKKNLVVIQSGATPFVTIRMCAQLNENTSPEKYLVCTGKARIQALTPQQVSKKIAMRYQHHGLEIEDIFNFVPYDTWLDQKAVERVARFQVSQSLLKASLTPDLYLIKCVDFLTRENVIPLYGIALELALRLWYSPQQDTIPTYEQVYGPLPEIKRRELKEVLLFIKKECNYRCKQQEGNTIKFDWPYLVKMANAYRVLSAGLICKWRQLTNFDSWVPVCYLREMFDSSLGLLQSLPIVDPKFHTTVSFPIVLSKNHHIDVVGHAFLETPTLTVHISFQQGGVSENRSTIALATTCLYELNSQAGKKTTYILSPQQNVLFRVGASTTELEGIQDLFYENYLLSAIARKFNLARSALALGSSSNPKKRKPKGVIESYFAPTLKRKWEDFVVPKKKATKSESPFAKFIICN